jgi:hypothetical protein
MGMGIFATTTIYNTSHFLTLDWSIPLVLFLPTITILTDDIVCILPHEPKAVIWKFSTSETGSNQYL